MSHNSYQKCKVCQNDVQTNLTWTDIGHMHAGFVHTLSKKFCSTNTLTGIGHWHPEFVHSLSNNFFIPKYHIFIGGQSVDKDWTLDKLWTYFKQGQTIDKDRILFPVSTSNICPVVGKVDLGPTHGSLTAHL